MCGEELHPTDALESPITGGIVSPAYECPNLCEYIEWLEKQKKEE
mgnify:CR=1 FL=1